MLNKDGWRVSASSHCAKEEAKTYKCCHFVLVTSFGAMATGSCPITDRPQLSIISFHRTKLIRGINISIIQMGESFSDYQTVTLQSGVSVDVFDVFEVDGQRDILVPSPHHHLQHAADLEGFAHFLRAADGPPVDADDDVVINHACAAEKTSTHHSWNQIRSTPQLGGVRSTASKQSERYSLATVRKMSERRLWEAPV